MPVSKKIKKILLLTDLVRIEEQEFEESDREYTLDFQKDFQKENSFLQETNPDKTNQSNEPDDSCLFAIKKEELKKLPIEHEPKAEKENGDEKDGTATKKEFPFRIRIYPKYDDGRPDFLKIGPWPFKTMKKD